MTQLIGFYSFGIACAKKAQFHLAGTAIRIFDAVMAGIWAEVGSHALIPVPATRAAFVPDDSRNYI